MKTRHSFSPPQAPMWCRSTKRPPQVLPAWLLTFGCACPRPLLAAAGGIHEANATTFAAAGADLLVTSAPYYAASRDVKLRMDPQL